MIGSDSVQLVFELMETQGAEKSGTSVRVGPSITENPPKKPDGVCVFTWHIKKSLE